MDSSKCLDVIARQAYSTRATVQASFDLTLKVLQAGVTGDIVECGVAAGANAAAMAVAVQAAEQPHKRIIWLYDSFLCLPKGGPNDMEDITGLVGKASGTGIEESTVRYPAVAAVKANMQCWGLPLYNQRYVQGWFQDTVPQNTIKEIAVLRLDGDLYDSTKVCAEYLLPKVSLGGLVIVDDYALSGCRKALHEELDRLRLHPEIITIEGGGGPVYFYL